MQQHIFHPFGERSGSSEEIEDISERGYDQIWSFEENELYINFFMPGSTFMGIPVRPEEIKCSRGGHL